MPSLSSPGPSMALLNQQWRLRSRPRGNLTASDFEWAEQPVPAVVAGQVLVRNVYLSLDPTNRMWAAADTYLPAVRVGDVMRGIALGVVEASEDPALAPGDLVEGLLGWQRYALVEGKTLHPVARSGLPLPAHLAVLGHIGLTAYVGLLDVGQPRPGDTLVVSAAAGAVGSLVGQIGKIQGCRVVGIAGTDAKCQWLTGELGLDAAINYRRERVSTALARACPDGIDVYFDNVGGEILDAALALINLRARVVLCGLISQYNAKGPVPGPTNLGRVLVQRARIEGFIVLDHIARAAEAYPQLVEWVRSGRLQYRVDVVDGLESAPEALNRLFDGTNRGKLVVRVSDEPS